MEKNDDGGERKSGKREGIESEWMRGREGGGDELGVCLCAGSKR